MAGTLSLDSHIVEEITQQLVQGKAVMRDKRTARLWLQYLEMVEILHPFIKSDRTGNWQLHLKMGQAMLSSLADHNYAKSLHLYLQNLQNLQEIHPEVYMHFKGGYHVIRRSIHNMCNACQFNYYNTCLLQYPI